MGVADLTQEIMFFSDSSKYINVQNSAEYSYINGTSLDLMK